MPSPKLGIVELVRSRKPCGATSLGRRINSQHFHELGNFSQMAQGIARWLVVAAQKVDVEDILPRPPRIGRDSILLRLISRKANTLSDLKSAPGTFFTWKAIEVLFAPARNQAMIV